MSNAPKYAEIFDYLSSPFIPSSAEPAIVFGRKDRRVALAAGELAIAGLAKPIIITGGFGKDSGDILRQGFRSEADYLNHELGMDAVLRHYVLPEVILEERATNGGENAINSLRILQSQSLPITSVVAVAHATSSRRLAAGVSFQAQTQFNTQPIVHRVPTNYDFNPENPLDQHEAAAELLRLADWPAQGLLLAQPDLPEELVAFARETID